MPDFGGVIRTVNKTAEMIRRVELLTTSDVLVGIPRENNARKDSPIGNAAIARVHEYGSPAQNIPARPFLHPGVKNCRDQAISMMRQGAIDTIKGNNVNVDVILNRVGMLARNSVVEAITDPEPPFAPLRPATIRARLRRTAAGRRKLKQIKARGQSLTAWAEAVDPVTGTVNIKPLLDTLQMRRAVTYVVRRGGL